jgi:hypothetical protein
MATYKVLQDIEAEDKLLGPLTLKQFIFAVITLVFCFIAFIFAKITIFLAIPWLVPIAFFGFMASPIGRDQPNDVWLAARIRFLTMPRKRIWNQSGIIELVTITAPKVIQHQFTNNLNQTEVRSRLNALASTMDSRGWAVKNVNVNLSAPSVIAIDDTNERLISLSAIPQNTPTIETDVTASDDVLDPMSNMVAQRFDTKLKADQQKHIDDLRKQAQSGKVEPAQAIDYSFITDAPAEPALPAQGYATFASQVIAPHSEASEAPSFLDSRRTLTPEEQAVLDELHKQKAEAPAHLHERVILPLSEQKKITPTEVAQALPTNKQAPDGKLQELSELPGTSIASLASLAKHAEKKADEESSFNEGQEISLH